VRFRLRVTLNGCGEDEAAAEQLLEAFATNHAEAGPIVSQDTSANTLTVVFSIEAADLDDAWERGRPIFVAGATASGLEAPDAIEINVSQIPASEHASEKAELQLA
jgi:hypothetical protein